MMNKSYLLSTVMLLIMTLFTSCNKEKEVQDLGANLLTTVPQEAEYVASISVEKILNSIESKELTETLGDKVAAKVQLVRKNINGATVLLFGDPTVGKVILTAQVISKEGIKDLLLAQKGELIKEDGDYLYMRMKRALLVFDQKQIWITEDKENSLLQKSIDLKKNGGSSIQKVPNAKNVVKGEIGFYGSLDAIVKILKELNDDDEEMPEILGLKDKKILVNLSLNDHNIDLRYVLLDAQGESLSDKYGIAGVVNKSILNYFPVNQDAFVTMALRNEGIEKFLATLPSDDMITMGKSISSCVDGTLAVGLSSNPWNLKAVLEAKKGKGKQLFLAITSLLSKYSDIIIESDENKALVKLPMGKSTLGWKDDYIYLSPNEFAPVKAPNYANSSWGQTLINKDMGYAIVDLNKKSFLAEKLTEKLQYTIDGYIVATLNMNTASVTFHNKADSINNLIKQLFKKISKEK